MRSNKDTKRWAWSVWSRFAGIISLIGFCLFSITAEDIIRDALIQAILLILTFIFIIVIPDKIIFGKYLVKRYAKQSKEVKKE